VHPLVLLQVSQVDQVPERKLQKINCYRILYLVFIKIALVAIYNVALNGNVSRDRLRLYWSGF
jgi:hypothetical protein